MFYFKAVVLYHIATILTSWEPLYNNSSFESFASNVILLIPVGAASNLIGLNLSSWGVVLNITATGVFLCLATSLYVELYLATQKKSILCGYFPFCSNGLIVFFADRIHSL